MKSGTSIVPRSIALALVAFLLVVPLSASTIGSVEARDGQRASDRIVLEQGGECYPLEPLGNGSRTIEAFYDYRNPYNMNESDPLYATGYKYSSFGTGELQRNGTSQLFLYNGSNGLSLVFVHGKVYGDSEEDVGGGGTVGMNVSGLPRSGYWAVEDDTYPGQRQLDVSPTHTRAVWTSKGGRTDGGAFLGMGTGGWRRITISPKFNERSPAYPSSEWKGPPEENHYTSWIARSGTERTYELDMRAPISLERGSCNGGSADPAGNASSEPATPRDPRGNAATRAVRGDGIDALLGTRRAIGRPPHPMGGELSVAVARDDCAQGPGAEPTSASGTADSCRGDRR